ncbi:hypothetical protein OK016_03660 [Vibrio chagasii]|nr:hypothetical protein [Vibrio chagasii]
MTLSSNSNVNTEIFKSMASINQGACAHGRRPHGQWSLKTLMCLSHRSLSSLFSITLKSQNISS